MSWRNADDVDQQDEGWVCGGVPFAGKHKVRQGGEWGTDDSPAEDEDANDD